MVSVPVSDDAVLDEPAVRFLCGDARAMLATLEPQSVHACVCSPPYYGLRQYDGGTQEIGHEQSPQDYVTALVGVFQQVWRVLRDDGLLFLVLGDSYAGSWGNYAPTGDGTQRSRTEEGRRWKRGAYEGKESWRPASSYLNGDLKNKDLIGIPWMVAFALRAEGWYLRSEIVWQKPNPMPSSVRDRPTVAHEHVFMLAKSDRYYYDYLAVAEPCKSADDARNRPDYLPLRQRNVGGRIDGFTRAQGAMTWPAGGRNKRSVWTVSTAPFSSKKYGVDTEHYAAYPPELIRPMVRAATSEKGVCSVCGAPWRRVTAKGATLDTTRPQARRAMELAQLHGLSSAHIAAIQASGITDAGKATVTQNGTGHNTLEVQRLAAEAKTALGGYWREYLLAARESISWQPGCQCASSEPVPATILDPFAGACTSALVARQEGRNAIMVDINPDYLRLGRARLRHELGLFSGVPAEDGS